MHTGKSKTKLAAAIGNNGIISPVLKFSIALESLVKTRQTGKNKLKSIKHNENNTAFGFTRLEMMPNMKLPIETEISQLAKIKPRDNSFP
jgi:hypothetical protein